MIDPTEEEIEYINSRGTSTPRNMHKKPHRSIRDDQFARWLTFGVGLFAAAWIPGVTLFHLHPSELTFTGFLAVLIFYTGEFLNWKRPRLPKRAPREPKQHHQWRDR